MQILGWCFDFVEKFSDVPNLNLEGFAMLCEVMFLYWKGKHKFHII